MKGLTEHIEDLIVGFLTGKITPAEREELSAWMKKSEENRRYFLRKQEVWFSCVDKNELETYDVAKAFQRFKNLVEMAQKVIRPSKRSLWSVMKYAAVVAAVVVISFLSYYQGEKNIGRVLDKITVEAPVGSQTRIELPDHSVVVLNAGSRLSYLPTFGLSGRKVELVGEGYFEVAHNKKLPFSVCSNSIQVNVIGTKFNFRDYPEDSKVSVCLYEGKVGLKNLLKSEEMILRPNEQMIMDKEEGRMIKETNKPVDSKGWIQGKLIYRDTPLIEVIHSLERSYGVDIRLATDSLKDIHINGQFQQQKNNLNSILNAIMATERINYKYERDQIILY